MNFPMLLEPTAHEGYARIYHALTELRESFHRSGRLDDSNAKLDEVAKLFATYLAFKNKQIPAFPTIDSQALVAELQTAFAAAARLPQYQLDNGSSIFGTQPALIIRSGDEALAADLVKLVRDCVDFAYVLRSAGHSFDILNEGFGHFVRDNFRGNIEDAQYMTPPEVVDFITDMVLDDIAAEDASAHDAEKHWTVLDPSCGVGSFLTAIYHRARVSNWLDPKRLRLYGQDKVERMVRLSTINLELFDVEEHRITVGNSLELDSPIDRLNGKVDMILTNPPFGARFGHEYIVSKCRDNTPFFSSIRRASATIDSELLFIDRNLKLLKEGGRLLIVVPDGVISAKGMAALLRHHIGSIATLRAVIELPPTAFAQAGTRTKTSVLYLQKGHKPAASTVFMGVSRDLGFQVASRKGVQIKIPEGQNDLPQMLTMYRKCRSHQESGDTYVLSAKPSCVAAPQSLVLKGSWTPNHYSAARFEAVETIRKNRNFRLIALQDLVTFCADGRKSETWRDGWAFISVLHILGEGFVDIGSALRYAPKTPGILTEPGELLISRINPRIPRVCITPDFGVRTLCSSEFEIMKMKSSVDVYTLAYLLQTSIVQNQIQCLTSGTSASHNRIRTTELGQVLVPIPEDGTKKAELVRKLVADYQSALESLTRNTMMLANVRARDVDVFSI